MDQNEAVPAHIAQWCATHNLQVFSTSAKNNLNIKSMIDTMIALFAVVPKFRIVVPAVPYGVPHDPNPPTTTCTIC